MTSQKIGPSKADNKALKDHLALGIDSPPPTPKSVRPPLDAQTDSELRSACAYILQNFKPSHVVYEEQYGSSQKPQLDYAAIKESVHRDMEAAPAPLSQVNTREPETSQQDAPEIEGFDPDLYRYKPDIATEDLFKPEQDQSVHTLSPRKRAISRAEQLMTSPPASKPPVSGARLRLPTHSRSTSNPMPSLTTQGSDALERPRTAPRTESVETARSTPETDATEYPWSEKASTAMTSAMITPARSSKRTSSQALHSGSESGSLPKVQPVDAEWMRQKLDMHKRAQEQMVRQQLEQKKESVKKEEDSIPAVEEATSSLLSQQAIQPPTPVKQTITRKPVPTPTSGSQQDHYPPRTDSRQSNEMWRAESKQTVYYTPRTGSSRDSAAVTASQGSRQSEEVARPESRARSITRGVKQYLRPSTAQRNRESEEGSRPGSRAQSITRQFRDFVRPATAMGSRGPSLDIGRGEDRSRSIDSMRSTVSDVAPSEASDTGRWRSWRPWHRTQDSAEISDVSRPGTSGSNRNLRGRTAEREVQDSSPQRKARPLNLNRELPPLPSLDQWKPVEPSPSEKPKDDAELNAAPELEYEDRGDVLAASGGSLATPRSQKPSVDYRNFSVPMLPSAPPPPPPCEGNDALEVLDDVLYDDADEDEVHSPLAATTTIEPLSTSAEVKKERRRSRSIQAAYPPELNEKVQQAALGQMASQKPHTTGKAQLVNYSRVAGGPINGHLGRKVSKNGHVANGHNPAVSPVDTTPMTHSRNSSDHTNFSRKFSSEDYSRMYDSRYQNMVEISASNNPMPPPVMPKEKPQKRKWWQGKNKKEDSWMDQVVKSGSRSGMILTDEVAGSPIVRY